MMRSLSVFVPPAPADSDAQLLGSRGIHPPSPLVMDSKKPSSGMLRHLRQKMIPHFRRGKANKLPVELDPTLDYRMSSSVPDVRDTKLAFARGPSSSRPLQANFPSYRSVFSSPVKPPGGARESGSGLRATPPGGGARRSEHQLSVPLDCPDWASSQESFQALAEDKMSSCGSTRSTPASMEPEEHAQPEKMPADPDPPPQEMSQDAPQVQTPPQLEAAGSPSLLLHSGFFCRVNMAPEPLAGVWSGCLFVDVAGFILTAAVVTQDKRGRAGVPDLPQAVAIPPLVVGVVISAPSR